MSKKPDKFLKLPEYPGGREYFKEFIKKNLIYPPKALENKIEGIVILLVEITDRGVIQNIKVEKGIGYGCDEEAVRLVRLMKFGSVKNRGLRVKTHKTLKIEFRLPKKANGTIQYNFIKENSDQKKENPTSYSYTINIGNTGVN